MQNANDLVRKIAQYDPRLSLADGEVISRVFVLVPDFHNAAYCVGMHVNITDEQSDPFVSTVRQPPRQRMR